MKQYPTILFEGRRDVVYHVWDKIDGSNVRVEWKRKQGRKSGQFYKFGSRKQLLASDQGLISKSSDLIHDFSEGLERYLIDTLRIDRCNCYFEFYGEKSFAGAHHEEDQHKLFLLDIEIYKRGFISQKDYKQLCDFVNIPRPKCILERSLVDFDFEQEVREGKHCTFEGVVCKASSATDKYGKPIMFKIKNRAWVEKVKETFKGNEKLLRELL